MFAYCSNNPVMFSDPTGESITLGILLAIGFVVGATIATGTSIVIQGWSNGWDNINWWQVGLDGLLGGLSGALSMSPLGWGALIATNAGIGFVGGVGGHLLNGSNFGDWRTWADIGFSTVLGAFVGFVGGPGATNAAYLNAKALADPTAEFIKAAASYDKVLTKIAAGGYKNLAGAAGARAITGRALTTAWNQMIVKHAGIALTKSLFFGGIASMSGTAGKGLLVNWLF